MIRNDRITAGLSGAPMCESDYTKLLLKHGQAELAESERPKKPGEPIERKPADALGPVDTPKRARRPPKRYGKRGKNARTELLKVRLSPEERAKLDAMAGDRTLSRFVRGLLSQQRILDGSTLQ